MISGANRGIGKAIALRLYQDGYLLSLGARDERKLLGVTAGMDEDRVITSAYEATSRQSAREWVIKTEKHFGQLDVVINNAGILRSTRIEDDDEDALDELWEINVKGPLRLTRAAYPYLKKSRRGRVINIVSLSGKRVKGGGFGYAMSKHAMMAFTHSLRHIGWEHGIRATAICPGWVNTEMVAGVSPLEPQEMVQPEDIARLVACVLELPSNASVAELPVNCVLESTV